MSEIYIPNPNPFDGINLGFEAALKELPLDDCRTERNPYLNDLLEFIPPEGFAFRVTGAFETDEGWQQPVPSRATFEGFDSHEQDEWDPDSLPSEFIGNRLSLELGISGNAVYGSAVSLNRIREDDELTPHVHVAAPLEFAATYGKLMEYAWEERAGSGVYHIETIWNEFGEYVWGSEKVMGALPGIKVEVVEHDFPKPEFEVIEGTAKKELQVVTAPGGPTRRQMAAYFAAGGMPMSAQELDQYMRSKRLQGFPLGDDPLRTLTIIQTKEDGSVPTAVELENIAERLRRIMNASNKAEREKISYERTIERSLEQTRVRLLSEVILFDGNGKLEDLVRKHASSDWLEREIDIKRKSWESDPVF